MEKIKFDIYTDGACSGNPGNGGWAFIATNGTNDFEEIYCGGELETTNNRMELLSIVKALEYMYKLIKKNKNNIYSVRIFSDSAYCVNAINKRWLKKWINNGWVTNKGTPVINKDLWLKVNKYDKLFDFQIIKVKGHSGNEINEKCDKIAKNAIEK